MAHGVADMIPCIPPHGPPDLRSVPEGLEMFVVGVFEVKAAA